jgi:transcriptional regulator GlxA family with amidase domain
MALAFHAHVAHAYGGISEGRESYGGLAPWQLRRACDTMEAELETNHSISRLAGDCGLSSSHFARAFKETTGLAPHQWLTRRRVQHARELLAQTTMDLTDIALACGFVDQSHFSRIFARIEKQSPGRWRRQRAA